MCEGVPPGCGNIFLHELVALVRYMYVIHVCLCCFAEYSITFVKRLQSLIKRYLALMWPISDTKKTICVILVI